MPARSHRPIPLPRGAARGSANPRDGAPLRAVEAAHGQSAQDSGHAIFTRLKRRLTAAAGLTPEQPDADRPAADTEASPGAEQVARQRHTRHGAERAEAPAPAWLPESQLEHAAPSAAALLARVWGTADGVKLLRLLVFDGQGLVRRWPDWVWPELTLLCAVHRAAHPGVRAGSVPDPSRLPLLETGYRHVVERLLHSWGNPEAFAVVCHDLFFDHRGDRAGWPGEVWEDLVLLQQIHERVHGRLPPGVEPWKDYVLHA